MKQTTLIVVFGPPATGKTHLAQLLAQKYQLPLFTKDQFKELMYEQITPIDLSLSNKMGKISFDCLNIITNELLSKKVSLIVEGNFSPPIYTQFLAKMKAQYSFQLLQIRMQCDGNVLLERFIEREKSGKRHKGHQGLKYLASLRPRLLAGKSAFLKISSSVITINTSNLAQIDYTPAYTLLDAYLLTNSE